jgi:alpha-glucosidase
VGTTVDENGYLSNLKFDFLDEGKQYLATIYADAPDANYKTNPHAYVISKVLVTKKSVLKQKCAPGGGYAISVIEITDKAQLKGLKKL